MIQTGWGDLDHSFAVMIIREGWSADEIRQEIKDYYGLIKSEDHTVDCVIDVRYAHVPPVNILSVFMWSARRIPENTGKIVLVSRDMLWKRLYQLVSGGIGLIGINIEFVSSMDEAYALVASEVLYADM
ncbi:MAG: hypothetical protein AAFN11_05085 [Chloroflexota bacterium]